MKWNIPGSKNQAPLASNIPAASIRSPPRPEKVARVRANSVSSPSPPQVARKRSSSGVFQVDDAEPAPKKTEHARTQSDGALKKSKVATNGRRKVTETSERVEAKEQKKIERFDKKTKTKCVNAFKESDSWD